MKIFVKIVFALVLAIMWVASVSAQTDKRQWFTSVDVDLDIKDLTKDVTALYVDCTLFSDAKDIDNRAVAWGYAILYEEGALNAVFDEAKYPTIKFIPVRGFPRSGVKQSISVNVFGGPRAAFWTTGECQLALSNKDYSASTDWLKTIEFAFGDGLETPTVCNADTTAPEVLYLCVAPRFNPGLAGIDFNRFGKTSGSKTK